MKTFLKKKISLMKRPIRLFLLCCTVAALVFPAQTLAQLSAEICVWDANGGGCEPFPYQSGCLCDHGYEWGIGDKTTTVDISATSIVSMEFQLFYTTCQVGGNWEFFLNGTLIGTAENLDNNTCSCTPQEQTWPHVLTITDLDVLNGAWNFGASNQITVSFVGHNAYYPAWYSVAVNYEENVHASFAPTSSAVTLGTAATFDASSSYVDEGSISGYEWDFGDGATGTGVTVSHTYSSEGCYDLVLAVTDDIGRSGFACGTACAVGAVPTADAGGPYTVAELNPLTFDGSGSFDAEGIVKYEWDFGDGASGEGVSPSHGYTGGEYTVTLTVYDAAGQSDTDSTTVSVANAPPRVICVPWIENGESASHSTWDGKEISLKGTVKDAAPVSYVWNFGDGTSESGTVTDHYVIEARHTYTGSVGTLFIATLTVTDSEGLSGQDTYRVEIKAHEHQTEVDVAIDEGLWYLHKSMNRYSKDGQDFGKWLDYHNASTSASAVHAFEDKSHLPDGDPMEDPYIETVRRGINNMLSYMYPITVTNGFDRNGNGYLLGCHDGHAVYEPGIVMMALVASENRHRVAPAGDPDCVQGRTYGDIIEDMVEYLAYAQNDNPPTNSGWRYNPNSGDSDNSVTQWPVLGLQAAERWDIIAPEPVKDYLLQWLGYSQNTNGGFGYTSPGDWVNISKTGAGIIGLFYCGLGLDDASVVNAFNYINAHWGSDGEFWSGYPGGTAMLYGFYSVFKAGMSWDPIIDSDLFLAEHASMIPDHVWWNELSSKLVEQQDSNGRWYNTGWTNSDPMASAWAIQILAKALHRKYPVADANGPYEGDVGIPVCLDGSGSYHNDPYRNIVLYEWDCDNDGTYDVSCTDPTGCCCTYPSYGPYTARLRVTDDGSPTHLRDTDTATVEIHPPPHPPTAVCGGPYAGWIGEPVTFDCSGSFDINEGDYIALCEWDLDGDGDIDCTDPPGPCIYTWNTPYEGVVRLTVSDTTGLTDTCWTTVNIGNHEPVAIPGGPYSGCIDEPITIDGSASHDIDPGDSITCSWDLDGDREFDDCSECICEWSWSSPGNYDIGLQVTDSYGKKHTGWTTVSINPLNECGVCGPPVPDVGEPCGECGTLVCNAAGDGTVCDDPCGQVNLCFGINDLKIKTKDAKCKGITLMEVTSDQGTFVFEPKPGKEKLEANTVVDDGVNGAQKIHTSCSKPLEIGDVFGAYTVTDLTKIFDDHDSGNDIKIKGTFSASVPIDLAIDDVTYTVDDSAGHTFTFFIPAGSFVVQGKPDHDKFKFKSAKGSEPEIDAKFDFRKCEFDLKVKKVSDTGDITGSSLTVGLQIGINFGEEVVEAEVKPSDLKYKAKPKLDCCPSCKCKGIAMMEVTSDQAVFVFEPKPGKEKLKANIVVDDGVNGPQKIHTSCSKPIDVGDVYGPYTITDLVKIFD